MKKPYIFNYSQQYVLSDEDKQYNEITQCSQDPKKPETTIQTNTIENSDCYEVDFKINHPDPDTQGLTESLESTMILKTNDPIDKPDTGPLTFVLENDYMMFKINQPDTEIETRTLEQSYIK